MSSASVSSMGTSSVSGLVSGFDTDSIIEKMIEVAGAAKDTLTAKETTEKSKLTAWQTINTDLLAVETKISALAKSSAFNSYTATSSNTNVLTVSADTSAATGTYYIKVDSRAQAHQIVASSSSDSETSTFTSKTADIGTGTVKFTFANDSSKDFEVTIDSNNSTLSGLCNAINNADESVQASIINTGTTSNPQYQLLLTSTDTGDSSQFSVSADSSISVDFSTVIQNGSDATIELGSGDTGTTLTIKKNSNTIDDLIPGVTIDIANPDSSSTIEIDVTRDTSSIISNVKDFVTQYNALIDEINDQFSYDSSTETGGTLLGDYNLQDIESSLTSILSKTINGLDSKYSTFAAVGITQGTNGELSVDEDTLTQALESDPNAVSKLFTTNMTSDSSYISYVTSTSDTEDAPKTGWTVNITQAARQAQVTSSVAMAAGGLDQGETLTIGTSSSNTKEIKLSKGSTIDEVVEAINAVSSDTNVTAIATMADGTVSTDSSENTYITLKSVGYGSKYDVIAYSNLANDLSSGNTTGIGTTEITASADGLAGLNVEGTINGEAATGSGQILTSSSSGDTKGFSLKITATTAMSSQVYFTQGVATSLRDTLVDMTSSTGLIADIEDGINDKIDDIEDDISRLQDKLDAEESRLYTEFNNMETQLSALQSTSNYLTQQIKAMNSSSSDD